MLYNYFEALQLDYSNLSASIGFILAAFLAGPTPKIIPVPNEKRTAIMMAFRFNRAGIPSCCNIRIIHQLITTPIIHPIVPRTMDSLRNWIRMS